MLLLLVLLANLLKILNDMHIVFVGLPGVPYRRRACDIRLTSFANLLASSNTIKIVNWYSPTSLNKDNRGELDDSIQIIDIVKSRDTHGWKTKLLYLLSIIMEPYVLLKLNKRQHIDVIHVYTERVFVYITYFLIARLIGAKLVYSYVEDRSTFEYSSKFKRHLQNFADWIAAKCSDGVIPISDYLKRKALRLNSKLKCIKIPPICDFEQFRKMPLHNKIDDKYLLYCGSTSYIEVAEFIAKSFYESKISKSRKLVLVLSGNDKRRNEIKMKYPDTIVLSNLSYLDLISSFTFAEALFIPLRNMDSEIARFPNKVCEYIASHGVIISTNYGEIVNYFKHQENALLCNNYKIKEMTTLLDNLADGMFNLNEIKENAYRTGLQHFDLYSYKESINEFLSFL